jgi:hypothetical protein
MNHKGANESRNLHLPADKVEDIWYLSVVDHDEYWNYNLADEAEYCHDVQFIEVYILWNWLDLQEVYFWILKESDQLFVCQTHRES